MSVETYAQLRELSVDSLIRRFDQFTEGSSQLNLSFIREEIARRDADAQTAKIVKMTYAIGVMTLVMVLLTVCMLFKG